MMNPVVMVVLALCGFFLVVIPALGCLLVFIGSYFKRDTKLDLNQP